MYRALPVAVLALALSQPTVGQADSKFPNGFFWACGSAMESADGRLTGSIEIGEDGGELPTQIRWTAAAPVKGVDWGAKGALTLSAYWFRDKRPTGFDSGRLMLAFDGEEVLPRHGYFTFGGDRRGGAFMASFHRVGRKDAIASVDLGRLKRWTRGVDRVEWSMSGEDIRQFVTAGVLPPNLVSRLESDLERFEARLAAMKAEPQKHCEKTPLPEQEDIMI